MRKVFSERQSGIRGATPVLNEIEEALMKSDENSINETTIGAWFADHRIKNLEMLVADMAGAARGKIQPINGSVPTDVRLPEALFSHTVTNDYYMGPPNDCDKDMYLRPDYASVRRLPWGSLPTATLFMDCFDEDGEAIACSPRGLLKRISTMFNAKGWTPVVAPEVEFFLVAKGEAESEESEKQDDDSASDMPADPYGVDRIHGLSQFFDQVFENCRIQDVGIGGVSQELGPGQFEVNFSHGDPVAMADDVVRFKRILKRAAADCELKVSFLAKPAEEEAGSSLHLHQSVYDNDGNNVFSNADGTASDAFGHYIGGLQQHMLDVLLLFAPYANSYRRFLSYYSSPVNLEWGIDNRTVGLRVPKSDPASRRVENRLAGSDVNPYLVMAGSLACGYLGMTNQLAARPMLETTAYTMPFALHRHFYEALDRFKKCEAMRKLLGDEFVTMYCHVKELEYRDYQTVIPRWELDELASII